MSLRIPPSWERYRMTTGPMATDSTHKDGGFFIVPSEPGLRRPLDLIVSTGLDEPLVSQGWEHVSVKVRINHNTYTPSWDEMCWVKEQLWHLEDTVVQFHPPASRYINYHSNVLHLWRFTEGPLVLPPKELL